MKRLVVLLAALTATPLSAGSLGGGVITFKGPDGSLRVLTVAGVAPSRDLPRGSDDRRTELWPEVEETARSAGVDPHLVDLVIRMESGYNPNAVSPKGATGVMQLMPDTARAYRVADMFDPADNIRGGVHYLRDLLDRFGSDVRLALAAYNAGPEAVQRYGGIPPYDETENYVHSILSAYGKADSPALSGGFGRTAASRRPVVTAGSRAVRVVSNAGRSGEPALDRRLGLR